MRAQRELHAPASTARCAQGNLPRAAALNRARAARRRPLRPGARRSPARRATSSWRASASGARTSRSSPTTWAWATWRACCSAFGQRPRARTPSSTSTRRRCATPPPTRSWRRFGDDSSNYFWKLGAAMEIMRLARHDPDRLGRTARCRRRRSARALPAPPARRRRRPADAARRAADTGAAGPARRASCARRRSAPRSTPAPQVRAISGAPALRVTGADDGGWTFRVSRTLRLATRRRSPSSTFSIACRSST